MLARLAAIVLALTVTASSSLAEDAIENLLQAGRLAEAKRAIRAAQQEQDDALLSTKLGVTQLLEAVERLGQTSYRFGTGERRQWLPFFRLGVPPNENPEVVTYDKVRDTLQRFIDDIARAEATLAEVGDTPIKWKVDLAKLRLDLDGDGQSSEAESLGQIYLDLARPRWRRNKDNEKEPLVFQVGIDTGDVYWLRGYCHFLSAMGETLLAYDQQEMFDHTAQLFFPRAQIKHDFLAIRPKDKKSRWHWGDALDGVAMIHLTDWPVKEPERLRVAHSHLLSMVSISRQSWKVILTEEDDDAEWIPGPDQKSVLPRGVLSQAQIDAWHDFLNEAEALLSGDKLAPFWRDPSRGVNIKRAFYEPTPFNLLLWIQGSAAAPYLEEGDQTEPTTWTTFRRVFRGNFLGFAFWIN